MRTDGREFFARRTTTRQPVGVGALDDPFLPCAGGRFVNRPYRFVGIFCTAHHNPPTGRGGACSSRFRHACHGQSGTPFPTVLCDFSPSFSIHKRKPPAGGFLPQLFIFHYSFFILHFSFFNLLLHGIDNPHGKEGAYGADDGAAEHIGGIMHADIQPRQRDQYCHNRRRN